MFLSGSPTTPHPPGRPIPGWDASRSGILGGRREQVVKSEFFLGVFRVAFRKPGFLEIAKREAPLFGFFDFLRPKFFFGPLAGGGALRKV